MVIQEILEHGELRASLSIAQAVIKGESAWMGELLSALCCGLYFCCSWLQGTRINYVACLH